MNTPIIAVTNQKGGVGKTTTAINLSQALALMEHKILCVDLDPQGNATQGFSIPLESVEGSVADLIRDKNFPLEQAVHQGEGIDVIAATPRLAVVEREMTGITNSEHRLANHLRRIKENYDIVIIDTPPTFGPLMNSALNAASKLIVPVDSAVYAMMGIKELLAEVEEIRETTNPDLEILGYLLTLVDRTRLTGEIADNLIANFGDTVFEASIRRSVRLREAPVLGQTIFHHAPKSAGAEDYMRLAQEVDERLSWAQERQHRATQQLRVMHGGAHE